MTVTTYYDNADLIDQEIARHEAAIRELKSRRNTLAQISKLPIELLSKIMMFCVPPDDESVRSRTHNHWSWIKVSHICRHWRSVALGCPALWSRPDFLKPAWVPEMLCRSKNAPLIIKMTDHYITPKGLEFVGAALYHMFRAKELTLSLSRQHFEKLFSGINQLAPLLQNLSLDASFANYTKEPVVMLPEDFMGGHAPRLSNLELKDCYLPWDSPLLKNLTRLKLHQSGAAPLPSLEQFVGILNRMPRLEVLDLKNVLPAYQSPNSSLHSHLPLLRFIRLEGLAIGCAVILNHLTFSSTTAMQFSCAVGVNSESLDALLSSLSEISRRFSSPSHNSELHSLSVSITDYDGIIMDAGIATKENPNSVRSWLRLSMYSPSFNDKKMVEVVSKVCLILPPLMHLRTLCLEAPRKCFSMQILKRLLHPLSQVHTLQLKGSCTREILHTLTSEEVESPMMLPSLRTMYFKSVDFDDERQRRENDLLDVLRDCLIARYEYRIGVRRLRLEDCLRLDSAGVGLLKEIVVDVDWDRKELGFDDTPHSTDDEVYYANAWY